MLSRISLREFLNNSELKSILENLIELIEHPISISDLDRNLLLGQPITRTSIEESVITVKQQTIGFVSGGNWAPIISRLLSYLITQQRLVFFDDLTQIPNRRYFNLYFQQQWRHCQRENCPLSLLLCDLDFFKSYNDYYGHRSGDQCLEQVGKILQQVIKRPADVAFRYGGEEFAIILPNTGTEGAQVVAEQILQQIQQQRIPHYLSAVSPYLTVSLGIGVAFPTNILLPDSLFEKADLALYRAKATGRDRYCLQIVL